MRQVCCLLSALLIAAGSAFAQVTVDLQALDALPAAKPAAKAPAQKPAAKPAQRRAAATKPSPPAEPAPAATSPQTTAAAPTPTPAPAPPPSSSAPTATATPPAATLPTTPPPSIALAPIAPPPPPAEPIPPPPPPPISDTAASKATATGGGLRVTFGAGQADLSPDSAAAIKAVARSLPAGSNASFNVVAYAAGTPEDPSTARRLSLSRALAVRSALMADGVSSSRIYVRALGAAAASDDTPDRVDLAVLGGNAPPPDAAKSQPQ